MKRDSLKKLVSLGLVGLMAVGMLAGCGGGGDNAEKNEGGGSGSNASAEVKLSAPGSYPIVEEGELEMTMFTMSMPNVEDFATNDFTKYMEEKTGIKMNFLTGGRDDWEDKLNMILQNDDLPDFIFGVSPNIAKFGVKEEILIPIDQYLTEDIMPNYLKMMEQFGLDQTIETDGKIYSIANINDCFHCNYARKMWVNTAFLEEIGVEAPTTTEEFKDVCQKFLEKHPDGIAVAGAETGWFVRMQDFLMGAYTFDPIKSQTLNVRDHIALNSSTGKMECMATNDKYKEGLKFINELYQMGAIYDADFTQTGEDLKRLVNQAPVLFFTAGTISDCIDSASNPDLYKQYSALAPIAGPDGTQIAWYWPDQAVSSGALTITKSCKNPEAVLRWVDYFFSDIGDLTSQYGAEEGTDWVLNPEGEVGLNGEPAYCKIINTYSAEPQNHDWQDVGIRVAPADYRLGWATDPTIDPYSPDGLELLLYNASKELYEPYGKNTDYVQLSELKITDEEATEVSTIAVEIEKLIEETSVAFMTGARDIDADWDSYISSLDAAGLSTLIEVYQTAYDRMQEAANN